MSTFETIIIILLLVLILAIIWMLTEITSLKKDFSEKKDNNNTSEVLMIRLQAYERVTLLAERISLRNVLSGMTNNGFTSRQMQASLVDVIKQEYDYNISQQIYVSPEIWKAISNLKEQNMYIINQIAATLPLQATGTDLNKQIIDFLINNPKSSLSGVVLDAINFEAKKLL